MMLPFRFDQSALSISNAPRDGAWGTSGTHGSQIAKLATGAVSPSSMLLHALMLTVICLTIFAGSLHWAFCNEKPKLADDFRTCGHRDPGKTCFDQILHYSWTCFIPATQGLQYTNWAIARCATQQRSRTDLPMTCLLLALPFRFW